MSTHDDWDELHSLSDLLGAEENVQKWRSDLFEKVAPADDAPILGSEGFDMEAFHASRQVVLPTAPVFAAPAMIQTDPKPLCLKQVREYALDAHEGQLRRYTHEPYWKHLAEVAGLVASSGSGTPRAIALAWLHDVVEDTALTLRDIERDFGAVIADGVRCLTGSANTRISRATRKQRDRDRLAAGDADVHTVKLADIASNLASIGRFDPEFALGGYLEEKRLEVGVLTQGDEGLRKMVRSLWPEARNMAAKRLPRR